MSYYTDRIYPPLLHRVSGHFADERRELMVHARGRVLELGVGTGSNLAYYPDGVAQVVGIDPHVAVLGRATEEVRRLERNGASYQIRLHRANAERLPYDDTSFDTVVAFLTMCTIPDFRAAAREAYRVLHPEGSLLVMEHVGADHGSRLARWQRRLNPIWTRLAVGCHLNRDTEAALREAGFTGPLERYRDDTFFPPTAPRIRGILGKDGRPAGRQATIEGA